MNKKLTPEQKKEIYELYVEGTSSVKDIATAYSVNSSTVCKTAIEMGASPRQPQNAGVSRGPRTAPVRKICGSCKKHIDLKGAMFCPYCGYDIRSPRDLLIARIAGAMTVTKYLPEDMRDTMQKLLIDVKNELSKGV